MICCLSLGVNNFAYASDMQVQSEIGEEGYHEEDYDDKILEIMTDDVVFMILDELEKKEKTGVQLTEEQSDVYIMERLEEIYDRKNQSKIRLKSNGLPYSKSILNAQEQALFKQNPTKGLNVCAMAKYATDRAQQLFQSGTLHNGNGDAFRHAYWSGRMTNAYGAAYAEKWGNAHESTSSGIETDMDKWNNGVGRGTATEIKGSQYWTPRFEQAILSKISKGICCRIVNGKAVKTDGSGRK